MSDEVVEGLRVRDLVVELGYVDRAGLEEALDLQEDLHEQGVKAHLIDVLEDLGLIDEDQRLQVLLHQEMRLVLADLPGARRDQRHDRWVMAAIVSASLIRSPLGVLAAAAALAIGAWLAAGRPWRWVALGWLAATAVPGTAAAATAAAGVTGTSGATSRERATALLRAAVLTTALAPVRLLPVELTPLHYFVAAALALAVARRPR